MKLVQLTPQEQKRAVTGHGVQASQPELRDWKQGFTSLSFPQFSFILLQSLRIWDAASDRIQFRRYIPLSDH